MEILEFDGKRYMKSSKAAKTAGYTTDYVGQLCRSKKIDAHLVGRTWYVNEEELKNYRTESKRTSREKARKQIRSTLKTQKKNKVEEGKKENKNNYTKHISMDSIVYAEDKEDVLPALKKLVVESEVYEEPTTRLRSTNKKKDIIQKKKKIKVSEPVQQVQMTGDIKVTDASDEVVSLINATTFIPRIETSQEQKKRARRAQKILLEKELKNTVKHRDIGQTINKNSVKTTTEEKVFSLPVQDLDRGEIEIKIHGQKSFVNNFKVLGILYIFIFTGIVLLGITLFMDIKLIYSHDINLDEENFTQTYQLKNIKTVIDSINI